MTQESKPRLVDVCQSFPRIPEHMVPRDNILHTLERVFNSDIDLVFIEGDEGIGKTTLLAQFALRHPANTFSIFIKPTTRFGYEPSTVRYDLCCQLSSVLRPSDPCEPEQANEGYLQNLLLKLRRYLRGHQYYFILDGICDVADVTIRNAILDIFPIGQGFPVLLSGEPSLLPPEIIKSVRFKSSQVINFSLDETTKYLSDLNLEPSLIRELYQACGNGVPGNLASVRRSVQAGSDPKQLIKEKLTDLFEEEWKQIVDDNSVVDVVAIIAHAQHRFRVEDLSRILGCEIPYLTTLLAKLPFLTVEGNSSEVGFVSSSFAQFAADKLRDRQDAATDLIIQDLLSRPTTEAAIDNLPSYLHQSGKLTEVLTCLSPEYFTRIVEQRQSLVPVHQKVDLGISASVKLRNDGELIRFGVQKSAMKEMEAAQVWRSEIEALMAVKEHEKALNLAENTPLKEDRLHLLAVIAKFNKEQGLSPEDSILNQIRMLYGQIDATYLGDRAIDIAADLFYSCSDLAIDLIEQVSWTDGGENALDLAYARLSIAALRSGTSAVDSSDRLEAIRTRIRDPRLRSFTSSVAGIDQSAKELIAEVNRMDTAVDRLHLLRHWALDHPEREDAVDVVDYSLHLLIGTTAYAPNARVLRELATPLPFVQDLEKSRNLVGVFDSQKNTVEQYGPTEDLVRLQLLLARTEKKYNVEACRNRLVEIYFAVSRIGDLATKASCLAWLLSCLQYIDPSGEMDSRDQIKPLSSADLTECIDSLLRDTAEHYYITQQ